MERAAEGSVFEKVDREESEDTSREGRRLVIAVGDLHGHYPALERLLDALHQRYIIFSDKARDRLARGVTLVFTGDYIDRGHSATDIIARLQRLQQRNPNRVVTLFGNHELMALEDYDRACKLAACDAEGALAEYERTLHGSNGGVEFVREFGRSTSRSALANYAERMSRDGDIGSWIRGLRPWHDATVRGKTFLFIHGDIPHELLSPGALQRYKKNLLKQLQVKSALVGTEAKYGHPWMATGAGFFWSRSFRKLEDASDANVRAICDKAEADFIVTGHTSHPGLIRCYGGRIFDVDVGMTPKYGENTPQALVISESRITAFEANDPSGRGGSVRVLASLPEA